MPTHDTIPMLKITQGRPVLLIGKTGMLARAWMNWLDAQGIGHMDVDFPDFDLTKPASIAEHLQPGRFGLVVNCAAWTDVDAAETKEPLATAVNGTGVGDLARQCKTIGATLVHYSTDYVFDGQANEPYRTDQSRDPLNAYGRGKAVGEMLIEQSGANFLLIRTSWLYAPWGKNFVRTIAKYAKEKPSLKVVNDQRGRPTSAQHLAQASAGLLMHQARGIFHVTDGGACTWFEFAQRIAAFANPQCRVEPCATADFPRPAKRPAYSVLDLSKTQAILGPMPDWTANLDAVLQSLEPL